MRPLLVLILLSLVTSTALAGWGGKGNWEPDLQRDIDDGWMFTEPDTTPSTGSLRQVYFSGFYGHYTAFGGQGFNPNVATIRSASLGASWYFQAFLGVWRDCNNDGFVGLGDQGLFEYRSEVLGATYGTSICPASQTPIVTQTGLPPLNWYPNHNDGQWVREYLPLQWLDWRASLPNGRDVNAWNINDNDTRVWAQIGQPGDAGSGGTCPYRTYGMTRSTGGLLRWADCRMANQVTDNWNSAIEAVNGDNLGAGQLSFKDHPREQDKSASRLNVQNPWGKEDDAAFVEPWNCGAPQTHVDVPLHQDGVINEDIHVTNVSQPRVPPGTSTSGSLAGTANSTGSGFDECHRSADNTGESQIVTNLGTFDVSSHEGNALAHLPYIVESADISVTLKSDADVMVPVEGTRPAAPYAAVLGKGVPPDLGAHHLSDDGFWRAPGRTDPGRFNRNSLEPQGVYHVSYFAYVAPSAVSAYGLSLPKGSLTGTYGFEQCTGGIGPGAPSANGWECDPDKWYIGGDGLSNEPGANALGLGECPDPAAVGVEGKCFGTRVGDPYNLRDVDCYDDSVQAARELGVSYGLVTGTQCKYPGWAG